MSSAGLAAGAHLAVLAIVGGGLSIVLGLRAFGGRLVCAGIVLAAGTAFIAANVH